jgi:hypothetical protein
LNSTLGILLAVLYRFFATLFRSGQRTDTQRPL